MASSLHSFFTCIAVAEGCRPFRAYIPGPGQYARSEPVMRGARASCLNNKKVQIKTRTARTCKRKGWAR